MPTAKRMRQHLANLGRLTRQILSTEEGKTMAEIIKMPDGRKKLERLVELMYQTDYGTAEYMCMESEANRLTDAGYCF